LCLSVIGHRPRTNHLTFEIRPAFAVVLVGLIVL
jgi:hypothetical protein